MTDEIAAMPPCPMSRQNIKELSTPGYNMKRRVREGSRRLKQQQNKCEIHSEV